MASPTARRSAALPAVLAGFAAMAASGCSGADERPRDGRTVDARVTDSRLERDVEVERIVFSSDGERVPALLVTPRGASARGCLVWQEGLSSRKEDSAAVWHRAARLGLAVFSIDLRDHGERGSGGRGLERAVADPRRLSELVRGSASDLRRGIDYLERRPECRGNIGYGGRGLGGMIGAVLAGGDPRIRATVLLSTPPRWSTLVAARGGAPGRPWRDPAQRRAAIRLLSPLDPLRWVARISPRPVMLVTGRDDRLVPPHAAAQMAAAARPPEEVVDHRGADALRGRDAGRTTFAIESFLLRWLVEPTYSL